MPRSALENEEAKRAQSEALRGAGRGAFTWGVSFALMGGLAYAMSPIYRKLTIQFKVYVCSICLSQKYKIVQVLLLLRFHGYYSVVVVPYIH